VSRHESRKTDHTFRLHAPAAHRVAVTGSFCEWDPDAHVMKKNHDGHWETSVRLPHGHHKYRFVVDGEWVNDPACGQVVPTPFGSTNSVVGI
jgi:1,4-alpha-glucan branching enzyme